MTDWLEIVEAAYDVDEPSHELWLGRLIQVAGTKMSGAFELAGAFSHFPRGGALQILPHASTSAAFLSGTRALAECDPSLIMKSYEADPYSTMSMIAGRRAIRKALAPLVKPAGMCDVAGLVCRDPGPWGVNICAMLPTMTQMPRTPPSMHAARYAKRP